MLAARLSGEPFTADFNRIDGLLTARVGTLLMTVSQRPVPSMLTGY